MPAGNGLRFGCPGHSGPPKQPPDCIAGSRWEREGRRAATKQYIIKCGEGPRSAADRVNARF